MMNFIFSKKEAVRAGGCLRRRMSKGCGTVWHSWLLEHTGLSQHSGSSQSVRPSVAGEKNRMVFELVPERLANANERSMGWGPCCQMEGEKDG